MNITANKAECHLVSLDKLQEDTDSTEDSGSNAEPESLPGNIRQVKREDYSYLKGPSVSKGVRITHTLGRLKGHSRPKRRALGTHCQV